MRELARIRPLFLTHCSKQSLLNHLVGGSEQFVRHGEAERLGRLEVDHKLELGRLHDWQVSGLLAFENAADIDAGLAIVLWKIDPVAYETSDRSELALTVYRRQPVPCSQHDQMIALVEEEWVSAKHKRSGAVFVHGGKGVVDIACAFDID